MRKNRHADNITCENKEELGVDLNRNYDYQFGYDNKGSSD